LPSITALGSAEDQALLRHAEKLRLEPAGQHVRPLHQGGHLVEQRIVLDRLEPRAGRGLLQLAHDLGAALGKAGDHRALCGKLLRIAVGVADGQRARRGLEAVADRAAASLQPEHADRHHLGAVQRHQRMRRPHEVDGAPAVGQRVAHHLRDRQAREHAVERGLQLAGQRARRRGEGQVQHVLLAVAGALERSRLRAAGAQGVELLLQGRRLLAG